ncbi:S-layer homology domain-containing protein [Paenibacillus sp. 1_12]|uniref:S-layer homology domain-containing protein n=1 Tax=Paenibacillus sp. 1_12 TaxID=1566278 RepID=UPI0008E1222C|nr:S-layer homology domain-containing protein [Paenibacillus sp. 1_12]SFM24509.1 S-layer homology domain-containing protein [Paenibacillus sp. 1_12]
MLYTKSHRTISTMLVLILLFSMILPAVGWGAAGSLNDISDSYAQKEIQTLADKGIISGYEDGSFQPRKTMSRAELAKMVVLALGLKENTDKASLFTDVEPNSWYRGFVGALVESGITQGTTASTFSPEAKVTREELVVFFIRALGLESASLGIPVENTFTDTQEVSSWAQASVSLAFQIGFVNGLERSDGSLKFGPKENAERQALARLAYEFSHNKSNYIEKASLLTNKYAALTVRSAAPMTATTVEVTFNRPLLATDKADFAFDNGLSISNAELKPENAAIVVLTTSYQSSGTVYKLSYKGKETGITIAGFSVLLGGGGGGGSSSSANSTPSAETLINQGGTFTDMLLRTSGTFGPASGTSVITGTLRLDPGETGEITLQNVEANNIEVLSGSPGSIKLLKTKANVLKVNASAQSPLVRVQSLEGTQVLMTRVYSKVILESTAGTLGDITLDTGTANQNIILRGSFKGTISTNAANIVIKLEAPAENSGGQTAINQLNIASNAKITVDPNATLGAINISAPNASVELKGSGSVGSLTVDASAVGSILDIGSSSNIQNMQVNGNAVLTGDPVKIAAIFITVAAGVKVTASEEIKTALIAIAVQAINLIGTFSEYSLEKETLIRTADTAATSALSIGAVEADLVNNNVLAAAKQSIAALKAPIVADLDNAKSTFMINFNAGDTDTYVTSHIALPLIGANGTVLSWTTSNASIISKEGIVTRPASGQADVEVNLTVTFAKQGLTVTKEFKLIVKAQGSSPNVTTGAISGYVMGPDGLPIAGAAVTVLGTAFSAISDSTGKFTISNIPGGSNYSLLASLGGYSTEPMKVAVAAGNTTILTAQLTFTTWSIGTTQLAFDSSYHTTLAEGDQITGDFDTDKKMFVPLIIKDASGKVLTPTEIADMAYKFSIYSTGGIILEPYQTLDPQIGQPVMIPIVQSGIHRGKIAINSVSVKGIATITVEMKNKSDAKAQFITIVGEKRIPDRIAYSKAPNRYMANNTDNELKVKIYDQYGEGYKMSSGNIDYAIQVKLVANTIITGSGNSDYGFSLKSNDVANPNGSGAALTTKKFVAIPTAANREATIKKFNEYVNQYEDYYQLRFEDIYDKSFKLITSNAAPGAHYSLSFQLNEFQCTSTSYNSVPSSSSGSGGSSSTSNGGSSGGGGGSSSSNGSSSSGGGGAGYCILSKEISSLTTTIEVLDPSDFKNKLNYEAYIDKGINNTILALDNYVGGVNDATYAKKYYPLFTRQVKVRATTSAGETVSIPNSVTSVSSSNRSVVDATYSVSNTTEAIFIAGMGVGTAQLQVSYRDIAGNPQAASLNTVSKNEAPIITSLMFAVNSATIDRPYLQTIAALSKLYAWDTQLGRKLSIVDQYGNEYISDRTPETHKDDNGNAKTDQNIQLYQPFLKLSYTITDIIFAGGSYGSDNTVTINSQGQITHVGNAVIGFTIQVKSPSQQFSSVQVTVR